METWLVVSTIFGTSSAYAYYIVYKISCNVKAYRDELDAAHILLELEKHKNAKLSKLNKDLSEENKSLKAYKTKVKKVAEFFDGTKY